MDIKTEITYALVSASVSALDGKTHGYQGPQLSAFLGTVYDFMFKTMNRITTASTSLILGGSNAAIAIGTSGMGSLSGVSGITGNFQGWPFFLTGEARSGTPTSLISTGSTTIRKVLVGLGFSALPVASSLDFTASNVLFVYGSAFATSSLACSTGGQSAYFNSVPLPKASAGMVPVGWLNVPNAFASGATISTPMLITDWREIQGIDLSAIQGTVTQP